MKAVITAGGRGTRLSSITGNIPKPMILICGKPILEYQINCLRENGIVDIYIIVGYLGDAIKDYFKNGSSFGVKIQYIEENEPLGSAGSLFYLKELIDSDFIFLFGDLMLDIDFHRMARFHKQHNASITLLSHPNSHPFDSDLIVINDENLVISIDSKHNIRNYYYHNLVNSGVYIVSPIILKTYFLTLKKVDFEKDVVNLEIKNKTVYSYHSTEYVKDAGTPERYYSVCGDVKKGIVRTKNLRYPQKCVFFDRDGTINKHIGFANNIDEICLENEVTTGLKLVNDSEFITIIITNQPVIARGELSFEGLKEINNKIETLLGKEGVYFDDLFYCPHHPDKGFEGEVPELKIACNCRKPKTGLIDRAVQLYNIDLSKSYFVGDSTTDIKTGINAGIKTVLVKTGEKGLDNKFLVKADYTINNLSELKNIIEGDYD